MSRPAATATDRLQRLRWVAVPAFALVAAIFVGARIAGVYPWVDRTFDMFAYWSTRAGLDYSTAVPGNTGAYIYSPAFAHLVAPLVALPWPVFAGIWTGILAVTLWWLTGRWALVVALAPTVALSAGIGQVDVLMAAAGVVGLRWPAAWALPILTKVTPGIGLLWFAARREWRSLGIALAATAAIVFVSALIDPAAWRGWLAMLLRLQFPNSEVLTYLPVPLAIRLPLVVALVVWGARTDRAWVLPIAAMLALPTVWLNSPTILIGIPAVVAAGARTPAGAWLRSPESEPAVVRRRLAARLIAASAALDAQVEAAVRATRWSGLRLLAAVRRRLLLIDRRWNRRASSVER
ncbi:MAG: DUF2029 domain-containing protein [Chloroflexi bacterium]|nr:DUF2029 domain-containing protein [Chloroflexota bacterium]